MLIFNVLDFKIDPGLVVKKFMEFTKQKATREILSMS